MSITGAKWARAVRPPLRDSEENAAKEAGLAAASRNDVMPCRRIAFSAAFALLTLSAAVGAGTALLTRSWAASSSSPVGLPASSRQILPPGGSGVAAVAPASASARELTTVECPKLDWTMIGRFVLKASRSPFVTLVPAGIIASFYQEMA